MKRVLLAALAIVTFGIVDGSPARADWKDAIHGPSYFRAETERNAQRGNRGNSETRAQRSTRATAAPKAQRSASSTSNSSSGGSSIGSGLASYYWQPQRVASGGWFNPNAMTAAHKTLPFGTRVRVTNERNGQSVDVTINDRGPYIAGRVIDLSAAAAGAINMKGAGVVPVRMAVLGR
jgi:rare lipoprotein A